MLLTHNPGRGGARVAGSGGGGAESDRNSVVADSQSEAPAWYSSQHDGEFNLSAENLARFQTQYAQVERPDPLSPDLQLRPVAEIGHLLVDGDFTPMNPGYELVFDEQSHAPDDPI